MDFLREWLVVVVDSLIPRRYERPLLLVLLFVVGAACLGLGGWFLYRVVSGESEGLYVPATLFGGVGLLCVACAIRAARRG